MNDPKAGFSREESLWLDGALSPEETRRMDERVANDPDLAARVAAWREAMAMWRDDAARAATLDADAVAAAALARATKAPVAAPEEAQAFRRYAAAAVVLLGVGVAGSVWTETSRAISRPAGGDLVDRAVRSEGDLEFRDRVLENLSSAASEKEGR